MASQLLPPASDPTSTFPVLLPHIHMLGGPLHLIRCLALLLAALPLCAAQDQNETALVVVMEQPAKGTTPLPPPVDPPANPPGPVIPNGPLIETPTNGPPRLSHSPCILIMEEE